MNNKKSIIAICTIGILLILTSSLFLLSESEEQSKEEIEIGAIMPLSGDIVFLGEPVQKAYQLAVNEINEKGGIGGQKIKIIYEDGKCNGKDALTAVQKLINIDNVNYILGGACSGETLGVAPITEANKIILFSSTSSNPEVTNAGDYVFRNTPSDDSNGKAIAQKAIADNNDKVAVLYAQSDYSQGLYEAFKKDFESQNGDIVFEESFPAEETDFKTMLTKLKSSNAEAFYFIATDPDAYISFLKQKGEMGVTMDFYTNEIGGTQNVLDNQPNAIEGAIYSEARDNLGSQIAKEFQIKYKVEYGELPKDLPLIYLASSYDSVYIAKEAIEACGIDTKCMKEYLYSIKNRVGVAGSLTIDLNGDAVSDFTLKRIVNGKSVIIV